MRAVIIGNGDIKDYQYIKSKINDNDFIICADGGYNHAEKMGIVPDVLIGDGASVCTVCSEGFLWMGSEDQGGRICKSDAVFFLKSGSF